MPTAAITWEECEGGEEWQGAEESWVGGRVCRAGTLAEQLQACLGNTLKHTSPLHNAKLPPARKTNPFTQTTLCMQTRTNLLAVQQRLPLPAALDAVGHRSCQQRLTEVEPGRCVGVGGGQALV